MSEPTIIAMPGTPEWTAARPHYVGASEAAQALGVGDYGTALGLYQRKVNLDTVIDVTEAMLRGVLREPQIVEQFEALTGLKIKQYPVPMMRRDGFNPMAATLDARLEDDNPLECKNTTRWRMAQIQEQFPQDWYCQAQQQMAVVGADCVRFAILVEEGGLELRIVERDEAAICWLLEGEREFWRMVENKTPPAPDWQHKSTPDLIKRMFGIVEGKTICLSDEERQAWERQAELGREIKRLEAERETLRAQVAFAMGDAAMGDLPGCDYVITRQEIDGGEVSYTRKPYIKLGQRKVRR